MFRKLNHVFRPNHHGRRERDDFGPDYHSACTVRLVRSTSMVVLGERTKSSDNPNLKRSKSTVSMESTLYYYHMQEDRVWLYSHEQSCLEYLQALVALRRRYTKSVSDLNVGEAKAKVSSKKKAAPPVPPRKPETRTIPSAPPMPNVEDTLQFLDEVIASCDSEPQRKPYADDGHADVDFIVASSSAEHDIHSNWLLRVPRAASHSDGKQECLASAKEKVLNKKNKSGSTSSRLRLQRNPIHLPKVVDSALQTLRFKSKKS
ncbi:uncharacterized protein C13orf42 [Corythoichthys intestinalis]|uniref:uncharacterized protein C13orf42 n=1 Tax=Corythoichthys intestinalis TaxID=161448 RepID=UPI0025A54468|nr:uncharacterized protein C13orf42 [Corythoichthys intestinalis]XP_061799925.1 uncharacterized protein C13orf42 [Nerophis lumbriciformis]